jgi:hypothetical protein
MLPEHGQSWQETLIEVALFLLFLFGILVAAYFLGGGRI